MKNFGKTIKIFLIDGEPNGRKVNKKLVFKKDYLFSSPSAAAAVVMGRSANGLTEWRHKDGRILKAVESN